MEQNKIEMFIATIGSKLPAEKLMLVRNQLERLDDNKLAVIQSIQYKDPTTILLASIFAGSMGVDRFMLGQSGLGVAKLLTCGGMGIWTIIDWFTIMGKTREKNYTMFSQVAI